MCLAALGRCGLTHTPAARARSMGVDEENKAAWERAIRAELGEQAHVGAQGVTTPNDTDSVLSGSLRHPLCY